MAGVLLHRGWLTLSLALPCERFNKLEGINWPSAPYYEYNRSRNFDSPWCASSSNQSLSEEQRSPTSQTRRSQKQRQRRQLENLVTVNRSDCNWSDVWASEQVTTLEDLGLNEMVEASINTGPEKPRADVVRVNVSVSKVDIPFEVWLSPTRDEFVHPQHIGEDNDDPTVIYCPPWQESADLTAVVRDTIRLSQTSKAICSEACESLGAQNWESKEEIPLDRRWSPMFEALRSART